MERAEKIQEHRSLRGVSSVKTYIYLSVSSIHASIHPSIYLSIYVSIYLSIYLSIYAELHRAR